MSKRQRERDKQKRAEARSHGRNANRKKTYARMAEQGVEGAREHTRNARHRREGYSNNDNGDGQAGYHTQGYTPPGSGLYDVRTSWWDVLKPYRGF